MVLADRLPVADDGVIADPPVVIAPFEVRLGDLAPDPEGDPAHREDKGTEGPAAGDRQGCYVSLAMNQGPTCTTKLAVWPLY